MRFVSSASRKAVTIAVAVVAALGVSTAAYATTTATSRATAAQSRGVPRCTAADLGVWLAIDQGNGAAGTIYYPLEFTNLSGHTCSLFGYPGVSVLSSSGHRLGSPASWGSRSGAHVVYLAPGATAHTLLGYSDAAVSTAPGCDPVNTAVALSVIPPDTWTATHAAFAMPSCSRPGPVYLRVVEPISAGVGTINS